MPAIWHRKFTVRTRKFDGGCAAATTTCRAGAASVARKSSVTVCPGNRYSTPPSTAMLFLQSSSVLSRQRMASRSSRSPVLTPARQAGEAASLKKGPVTSAIPSVFAEPEIAPAVEPLLNAAQRTDLGGTVTQMLAATGTKGYALFP